MLDKKDVPFDKILQLIEDNHAESYVLVSSYAPEEAKWYYDRNPDIMFEAFILNNDDYLAYQTSGVPWQNMVAYLSQSTSSPQYSANKQYNRIKGVFSL
ncbi:hypothetical protein FW774_18905 [Pedobacter sp. BS3]|uniref:hypothetical protein n=1 Tax=Pedobacter sp. BS3 TaxID=2567937 RepID=UPI0011F039B8|nr:hypothetical protein [Pedobacter sp. BS3]TZF81344.1 hypothetical protein FW774_18905 [Pedobacter sp. BS3]